MGQAFLDLVTLKIMKIEFQPFQAPTEIVGCSHIENPFFLFKAFYANINVYQNEKAVSGVINQLYEAVKSKE